MNLLNYVAVFFFKLFQKDILNISLSAIYPFFLSAIKNCTSSKPFNRKCVSNHNYLNHQYQELFYLVSLKPANVQFFFYEKSYWNIRERDCSSAIFPYVFVSC